MRWAHECFHTLQADKLCFSRRKESLLPLHLQQQNVTRLERAAVAYADESAAKLKTQNAFFLSDPSYRMRMEIHGNARKIWNDVHKWSAICKLRYIWGLGYHWCGARVILCGDNRKRIINGMAEHWGMETEDSKLGRKATKLNLRPAWLFGSNISHVWKALSLLKYSRFRT